MDIFQLAKKAASRDLTDAGALLDYFEVLRLLEREDKEEAHRRVKEIRQIAGRESVRQRSQEMLDIYRRSLLFDAPYDLDAYCLYIEWNRQHDKKFYQPRRKRLKRVVDGLQRLADGKIELLGVSLPPGVGKALANDTPILTRCGWKNHGDLTVGDEVIGLNGEFKKVIAVHPKCQLDVLVELTNGEKIQCHENHEWMVNGKLYETKELEKKKLDRGPAGKRGHKYLLRLPITGAVQGEDKELPVDPYFLGAWLGDGANKEPTICNAVQDKAIIDRIEEHGIHPRWKSVHKITGVWYYGFGERKNLQKCGMCYSRRRADKHIPSEYLTASTDQRLQLLAGLLDTDGNLENGNRYRFTTCEESLRDSFIELISTFGWRTGVTTSKPHTTRGGVIGRKDTYVISFVPDMAVPCAVKRKQNEPGKRRKISIKSITRVEPKEGNCITVEGDGMYLAGRRMVPTHNTTLGLFNLTWLSGRNPEKPILTGSHSNAFLRGAYDECLRIMDPSGDYLWSDVFPDVKVIKTNAQDMMIDVGKDKRNAKRFSSLEFSSVGSGNAGKVRAEALLYCDDLVDGLESALSRERMDKLWAQYTTDLRQRKIGDCKELHIATRWSVHDVIGRLESTYGDGKKAEFIVIPALNENDESNFDYGNTAGFTTKFYHEQREIMDDASWRALYMNEPIEREGQLYNEDELRRYFELPDREPDAIISVCDTKDRGVDYCVMPIAYQYGQDFYIEEIICDNGNPETVEPRLVQALNKHKVHMSRFESNSAGGRVAENVQKEVKAKGGRTRITTKFSTTNKETRIIMAAGFAKEHFLFKDNSVLKTDKEYRRALGFLCGYTMAGKNKFDDVPDAISMLVSFIESFQAGRVEVRKRLF